MRRIIILTGVSCSGKTTLQKELERRGWKGCISYTTRQPRDKQTIQQLKGYNYIGKDFNGGELDDYIFLSTTNFLKKLRNRDFLEFTTYGGNYYGISNVLPKGNICLILDPIGRSQALEYFSRKGIEVETYYLDIPKELQAERLENRGDSKEEIFKRKRDYNWFYPTNKCIRLNGAKPIKKLADIIGV